MVDCPGWEEFLSGELKTRNERDTKTLGGGPERKTEDEPDIGDPSADSKFSSHNAAEAKDQEVQEENIVEEEGEKDEHKKVTVEKVKEEAGEAAGEKKEGLQFEEANEVVINPEIDAKEQEKLDTLNKGTYCHST